MRINEIFYSIQGEGCHTGTPAVFVRFSGCNLKCPFCDTQHDKFVEMQEDDVVSEVMKYACRFVVITGGEPALQLTESLVEKLHRFDRFICVETNGTLPLPSNVDWITVSPKQYYVGERGEVVLSHVDEVKIVIDGTERHFPFDIVSKIIADNYYIQPCDVDDEEKNKEIINHCIDFIKANPSWKLSLQTQKILNVQ